jgi:hypothetical protein
MSGTAFYKPATQFRRKWPVSGVSSNGKSICLSQKSSWNGEMLFAWSCVVED